MADERVTSHCFWFVVFCLLFVCLLHRSTSAMECEFLHRMAASMTSSGQGRLGSVAWVGTLARWGHHPIHIHHCGMRLSSVVQHKLREQHGYICVYIYIFIRVMITVSYPYELSARTLCSLALLARSLWTVLDAQSSAQGDP